MESAFDIIVEPNRRAILSLLVSSEQSVGDIERQLGMTQTTVSKHLRVLREAGLLEVEKDGRQRLYALPDAIRRQAAAGKVLDLGCCSFQFEAPAAETSKSRATATAGTSRKRKSRR